MMVEMVDPNLGDTIYDPACGTGGFLIDAVEYILARYSTEPQEVPIYGEEWLEKRDQSIKEAKKRCRPTVRARAKRFPIGSFWSGPSTASMSLAR